MREHLELRLETLKSEFEIGQAKLSKLDHEQMVLRETLLRISGAIQVLQEALGKTDPTGAGDADTIDDDEAGAPAST